MSSCQAPTKYTNDGNEIRKTHDLWIRIDFDQGIIELNIWTIQYNCKILKCIFLTTRANLLMPMKNIAILLIEVLRDLIQAKPIQLWQKWVLQQDLQQLQKQQMNYYSLLEQGDYFHLQCKSNLEQTLESHICNSSDHIYFVCKLQEKINREYYYFPLDLKAVEQSMNIFSESGEYVDLHPSGVIGGIVEMLVVAGNVNQSNEKLASFRLIVIIKPYLSVQPQPISILPYCQMIPIDTATGMQRQQIGGQINPKMHQIMNAILKKKELSRSFI
eukprot:403336921